MLSVNSHAIYTPVLTQTHRPHLPTTNPFYYIERKEIYIEFHITHIFWGIHLVSSVPDPSVLYNTVSDNQLPLIIARNSLLVP